MKLGYHAAKSRSLGRASKRSMIVSAGRYEPDLKGRETDLEPGL